MHTTSFKSLKKNSFWFVFALALWFLLADMLWVHKERRVHACVSTAQVEIVAKGWPVTRNYDEYLMLCSEAEGGGSDWYSIHGLSWVEIIALLPVSYRISF